MTFKQYFIIENTGFPNQTAMSGAATLRPTSMSFIGIIFKVFNNLRSKLKTEWHIQTEKRKTKVFLIFKTTMFTDKNITIHREKRQLTILYRIEDEIEFQAALFIEF